ncbi:PilW family protein [Candidatus Cryosericum septentrionale]|uniref:PilW family protein n=1 Tax=Candidatus Cryosericum septentrionale TaxID=2290913 RepID=UPI00140351DB|nr:prepilin-type N-terminal cleavage/methylation domain-containing protein [Candidatus Cryosericum septentrionale]
MGKSSAGFTLVELMISMAVMVLLAGALFSVNFRLSSTWMLERRRQGVQQNFRFAADTMTGQIRAAMGVLQPADNTMTDVLEFDMAPSASSRVRIKFERYPVSASGPHWIVRTETPLAPDAGGNWVPSGPSSVPVPVTEELTTLTAVHFIRHGSRLIVVLVGEYEPSNSTRTVTYTTQTTVRVSVNLTGT